jgi:hypothetical protein
MAFNSEEDIRNLVKSAYRPARPPTKLKKQLLERLTLAVSDANIGIFRPLREQPRVLVPILVAVTCGLVGYGIWLSLNVVSTLLP